MYNHYDRGMHPKQSVLDQLLSLTQKQVEGERTMTELQRVSGFVAVFVSVERQLTWCCLSLLHLQQLAVADGVLPDPSGPINTPAEQDSPSEKTPTAPVVQSNGSCAPLINGDAEEAGPGAEKCNEKKGVEPGATEHDLTSSEDKPVSVETEHSKEEVQESSWVSIVTERTFWLRPQRTNVRIIEKMHKVLFPQLKLQYTSLWLFLLLFIRFLEHWVDSCAWLYLSWTLLQCSLFFVDLSVFDGLRTMRIEAKCFDRRHLECSSTFFFKCRSDQIWPYSLYWLV